MKYYTIDFTGTADLSDFYQRIIKGLEFPDWCGESIDAIWDMLTGHMDVPAHITVVGGSYLTDIMVDKYQILKETFDDTIEWYKDLDKQVMMVYK